MARHTQALRGLQSAGGFDPSPTYTAAHELEAQPAESLIEKIMNGQHASMMELHAPESETLNQPTNGVFAPNPRGNGGRPMIAAADDMSVEGGPFGEADTGPFGFRKQTTPSGLPIQALHGLKGAR